MYGDYSATEYYRIKHKLWPFVREAFEKLSSEYDLIVVEGAGSPAEINLKADDFVNMGLAKRLDIPVLLAGDRRLTELSRPLHPSLVTVAVKDGYGGLTRFDGRRFEAVEGVSSAVSLFTDSRGRLWVGTSEMGAVCLDGGSLTVYGPEEGLNSSVRGFCEEENGDILMATRSGLFLLDGNGQISQLPDELGLLIDEHIPDSVTQVFFI